MKSGDPSRAARRKFLKKLGRAVTYTGAVVATLGGLRSVVAKTEPSGGGGSFPTKDYDWTKHRWGYGVDATKCIGCQYCIQACPYGARYFNEAHQVSDKCTWCYHRITRGLQPACVEVCPVGARIFGDLDDKQSPISQFIRNNRVRVLKPENGTVANVYYVGLDKDVI